MGYVRLGNTIKSEDLHVRFDVQRKLGGGSQGQVVLCRDRRTSQEVVVKMYNKSSPTTSVEDITREFEILMQLRHPHIAHVFEIFQDWSNVYVVQEPYFGGDLTGALRQAKGSGVKIDELWLARVMVQVLKGVSFLHSKAVMHCDLKEPNVMVTSSTDWHSPQVVVIDFGLASEFATKSMLLGTPGYMPPEVWDRGLWTPRGDVFSLGVMLFSMRTGRQPFTDGCSSFFEVQQQTREHHPVMPRGTQALQDLVCTMLEKSFHRRPTVCLLMEDYWFASATEAGQEICDTVLSDVLKSDEKRTLTRALLADVAARANLAQMKELNELFLRLDADNDGCVTERELRDGLSDLKWPEDQMDALVRALVGHRGELRYEEFMGMLMGAAEPAENELLWRVFKEADELNKGFLDVNDVAALLQRPAVARVLGGRDVGELLQEMDWNNDQRVTFESFRLCVQGVKKEDIVCGTRRRLTWRDMPSPTRLHGWQLGDRLQFYSMASRRWEACEVVEVDQSTGAVQADCCVGYWVQGLELHTRLRRPGTVLRYMNPLSWGPLWVQQVSRACSSRSMCGMDLAYLNN